MKAAPDPSPSPGVVIPPMARQKRFWLRSIWLSIAGVIVPVVVMKTILRSAADAAFQANKRDPGGGSVEALD
ncbi:MAG: hypothetical protein EOP85_17810, partial [Verrucomicrobiaceae bacterium]